MKISKKISSLLLSILILMLLLPASSSASSLITEKKVIVYNNIFEGESESWKAKYMLNETHIFITTGRKTHYDGKDESKLVLTYRGNLSLEENPKQFQYFYEAGRKGGSGNFPLDRKDCIVAKSRSETYTLKDQKPMFRHTITAICTPYKTVYMYREGGGGTVFGENDTVKVVLRMDGKKETLELKRTN